MIWTTNGIAVHAILYKKSASAETLSIFSDDLRADRQPAGKTALDNFVQAFYHTADGVL
jgi:hypothetical protein